METGTTNGRPAAVVAKGLDKRYRLGEHRSLQRTLDRILRPRAAREAPLLDAVTDVNFTVYRGESFGLVGTNGSGKSTVLQILGGTTLPTGGQMRVRGRVLPLLAVGTGFHPELTGRENVLMFGTSVGVPTAAIQERMDAVAAFGELERHMDTPVKRYSSGMVSRLSFSIAVQFPADIYLFDEVLAVVDGDFHERCVAEIKRLHLEGRTIISVSHDLDLIAEICGRVMWMEKGRVRAIGDAPDVLDEYSHYHSH
jgi:ABC-type polysaccharide/polyol phosphate transport system ATPase subunit